MTCAALPGLHADDRLLLGALRDAGMDAEPAVWEDPLQDWGSPRLCVIRSTWDYAFRREQFVAWARAAEAVTTVLNPVRLVEWNTHKSYLCDLATRDAPVVPTVVLPARMAVDLSALLRSRGWRDAVLKAAVAQSGRYAMRVMVDDPAPGQAHLDRVLRREDMLLQPYLPGVQESGELSLVFVEGEFTHAVRKRPARGDFRVHDDHGGSVTAETPARDELAAARAALAAVGEPVLYARVDLVRDAGGNPLVMELEVVEPELFFRFSEDAVARLVGAIRRRLKGT